MIAVFNGNNFLFERDLLLKSSPVKSQRKIKIRTRRRRESERLHFYVKRNIRKIKREAIKRNPRHR